MGNLPHTIYFSMYFYCIAVSYLGSVIFTLVPWIVVLLLFCPKFIVIYRSLVNGSYSVITWVGRLNHVSWKKYLLVHVRLSFVTEIAEGILQVEWVLQTPHLWTVTGKYSNSGLPSLLAAESGLEGMCSPPSEFCQRHIKWVWILLLEF